MAKSKSGSAMRSQKAEDITFFSSDLEKIYSTPGMYIGTTDSSGVFNMFRECADNAVDEAKAKRNNYVGCLIDGNVFTVVDAGGGIPVKKHPKAKISTLTHVLTNLQSSGKKVEGPYKGAAGVHGAGQKAVTALSSYLDVFTFRKDEGGWWTTSFKNAKEYKKPAKCKAPKFNGKTLKKGTLITFSPNPKIFGKAKIDIEDIYRWAELTAYMNPKLEIEIIYKNKSKKYYSKEGIFELVRKMASEAKVDITNKLVAETDFIDLALAFTNGDENIKAYTNTVYNCDGGFHLDAFYKAYYDCLKEYMGARDSFTPVNVREGLIGIINYKITAPQFNGQVKNKLVDERVKDMAYDQFVDIISKFFSKNRALAKDLCKKASEISKLTEKFKADRKLVSEVKKASKLKSAKLSDIVGNVSKEKSEIFLVEGDSAAGSARQARDRSFQAVFALKGKPLNVLKASATKINSNVEIVGLLAALGIDLDKKSVSCKYGKVIILSDGDIDGNHIASLLFAFFHKFAPELYTQGRIFRVDSPRYRCVTPKGTFFGNDYEQLRKKYGKSADITYLKGLGELQPDHLKEVAFAADTRYLQKITPSTRKKVDDFERLVGEDTLFTKKVLGISREF